MRKILLLLTLLSACSALFSQSWTYRTGPDTLKNRSYYAYLWIPETTAKGIRGLILAPQISAEWQFVRNQTIRKTAEKEKLAIIYFNPSRVSVLNAADTTYLLEVLNRFAEMSGYREIKYAPWFTFGHSTGCLFAMYMAYWKPERTLGVICYKGGIVPNPSWFGGSINNIPVMGVQGEYEEYDNTTEVNATEHSAVALRKDVLRYRSASADENFFSATILPGEGHMLWTETGVSIIAEFIGKAAKYRIPKDAIASNGPVKLKNLNLNDGWAATGDPHISIDKVMIGPMSSMSSTNSKDSCYWFFDEEFARHWLALHQDTRKERQFVSPPNMPPVITPEPLRPLEFVANGKLYETRILMDTRFSVKASSSSGLPVDVNYQTGPGIPQNGIFRINPADIVDDMTIRVGLRQNGDTRYKIADRLIKVRLSKRDGKPQAIKFTPVNNTLHPGDKIKIEVKSDSGLPVTLSLNSGPGELVGDMLHIKPFTSKTGKTVVIIRAGQEGNGEYATAQPVELKIEVGDSP
jgi:hypothetical protein